MESENVINPYPMRKMLTSKTGSNYCYITPHPDGSHLVYKWTSNGVSTSTSDVVKWFACAGCKSSRNKDNDETMPSGIEETARKLVEDYYTNWVDTSLGRNFFSLYEIKTNRTTNYAEAYHWKQKYTFGEKHLPLGTWIFHQREAQHADDNKLNRVMKNYDDPPAADEKTLEADFNIDEAKNQMDFRWDDEDYEQKEIFQYYSLKLGKLLGYKNSL